MKPLSEGLKVYSRPSAMRELRPPKVSQPKAAPGDRQATRYDGACAWVGFSVLTALGAFVLSIAVLS